MTSEHDLNRQLRSVLREVLDQEWGPDPVWAESPAARRISEGEGLRRRLRWPLRTLAVAALLVVGGGALILGGALDRPRPPDPSVDLQGMLDELAPGPGIRTVAMVQSPAGVWRGVAGTGGDGQQPAPGDSFLIIGTTETFTATVVLQLVGEGRVALDDSVERWLPGLVPEGERVTIRQLLNHTSGVGGNQGQHHYANENYLFLGRLVEVLTGESLDVVLRDRIFPPLRLEHTTMTTLLTQPEIDATSWLGAPAHVTSPPASGAGGIVSTTADLATFFGALLGGDLLAERELSEMLTTVDAMTDVASAHGARTNARAGLGIFSFGLPCGVAWGHGGDYQPYSNWVLASEDGSRIVAVAQNRMGFELAHATAAEMFCHSGS